MNRNIIQTTKNKIIQTSKKLFAENSYIAVSMNDIAKKLKLTKASLYYHFTGKSELYKETLNQAYQDFRKSLKPVEKETNNSKKLYLLTAKYIAFISKEKTLITAMYSKSKTDESLDYYIIDLKKKINKTIEKSIINIFHNNEKVEPQFLATLLISMMDGIVFEYSLLNKKIDANEISKKISKNKKFRLFLKIKKSSF